MTEKAMITREEALERLSPYGIKGALVYLIDIIPLIEMSWADGIAQDSEIAIINEYLRHHIDHINDLAGSEILTEKIAHDFVSRFLHKRPDPELLRTLRSLVAPLRLSMSNNDVKNAVRNSLLTACLDIASSAATQYPYVHTFMLSARFTAAKKALNSGG